MAKQRKVNFQLKMKLHKVSLINPTPRNLLSLKSFQNLFQPQLNNLKILRKKFSLLKPVNTKI
jgi:hypothetical protein